MAERADRRDRRRRVRAAAAQLGDRGLDRVLARPFDLRAGGDPARVGDVVVEVDEQQITLAGRVHDDRLAGNRPAAEPADRGAEPVGAVDDHVLGAVLGDQGVEPRRSCRHLLLAEPGVVVGARRRGGGGDAQLTLPAPRSRTRQPGAVRGPRRPRRRPAVHRARLQCLRIEPRVEVRLRLALERQRAADRVIGLAGDQQVLGREPGDHLAAVLGDDELLLDPGRRPAVARGPERLEREHHPLANLLRMIERYEPREDRLLPDRRARRHGRTAARTRPPRRGSRTPAAFGQTLTTSAVRDPGPDQVDRRVEVVAAAPVGIDQARARRCRPRRCGSSRCGSR